MRSLDADSNLTSVARYTVAADINVVPAGSQVKASIQAQTDIV